MCPKRNVMCPLEDCSVCAPRTELSNHLLQHKSSLEVVMLPADCTKVAVCAYSHADLVFVWQGINRAVCLRMASRCVDRTCRTHAFVTKLYAFGDTDVDVVLENVDVKTGHITERAHGKVQVAVSPKHAPIFAYLKSMYTAPYTAHDVARVMQLDAHHTNAHAMREMRIERKLPPVTSLVNSTSFDPQFMLRMHDRREMLFFTMSVSFQG